MECIQLPYDRDPWQYRFHEKKLNVINLPIHLREVLDIRGRGASKTFDTQEDGLFYAHMGFKVIWFAAKGDQIEQPKKYMKWIIENSFLKYMIAEMLKESVTFQNGGEFRIKNLTEMNARSSRADLIIYDEEAQADPDAYNAAVNILAGSELGMIIHISTPKKASVFETNYDRLMRRQVLEDEQFIFKRTWQDASWLYAKKEWYEEQQSILPDWYFRQEHMAEFTLPLGAVFQNVVYMDIPSWIQTYDDSPLCSGIDWNPVSGHWLVGGRWIKDEQAFVVQHCFSLGVGYSHEMKQDIYMRIRPYFMHGKRLCVEDGGINIAYCDWLRKTRANDYSLRDDFVAYEEWDSAGLNKTNTVQDLQGVRIYCDEMTFHTLAKQIQDCRWNPDATKPELEKDPADSPHALDAFLHACSPDLRRDVYIFRENW